MILKLLIRYQQHCVHVRLKYIVLAIAIGTPMKEQKTHWVVPDCFSRFFLCNGRSFLWLAGCMASLYDQAPVYRASQLCGSAPKLNLATFQSETIYISESREGYAVKYKSIYMLWMTIRRTTYIASWL